MKCPTCHQQNVSTNLYFGLPFYLCEYESCVTGWGPGAWIAAHFFFNGILLRYEGSYWKALWHWLFHSHS